MINQLNNNAASTKQKVLEFLKNNQGYFISGENLAKKIGISRTSVWKAMQSLKTDGYNITASSKNGYQLINSDMLSSESILDCLNQIINSKQQQNIFNKNLKVLVYKTIDSTNTEAKKYSAEFSPKNPCIFLAEQQTAGRGRLGRQFFSPAKTGIYLSILYKPSKPVIEPSIFTATAAVGVCRAIFDVFGIQPDIKWVNDIFVNGKKVCGILTEGITDFETNTISSVIIGIGININDADNGFPEEISKIAGSICKNETFKTNFLSQQFGIRTSLAASVIFQILWLLETEQNVISEYKKHSFIIGKTIEVLKTNGENYSATAIDIDENAHLIAEKCDGERVVLQSGEVSLQSKQFT